MDDLVDGVLFFDLVLAERRGDLDRRLNADSADLLAGHEG